MASGVFLFISKLQPLLGLNGVERLKLSTVLSIETCPLKDSDSFVYVHGG